VYKDKNTSNLQKIKIVIYLSFLRMCLLSQSVYDPMVMLDYYCECYLVLIVVVVDFVVVVEVVWVVVVLALVVH